MRFRLTLALALVVGCGHVDLAKATATSSKAISDLGKAATVAATAHHEGAKAVIEICRAQVGADATSDAREACVSRHGYNPDDVAKFEAAIAKAKELADTTQRVLDELEAALPYIEKGLEAAKAVAR